MGEETTPKEVYHLILKPTLNYKYFILIFEKSMSASHLLSTELTNLYPIGLAVFAARGKGTFILRWRTQIRKKQMRLSNETKFQKRWLGKERTLVIHRIKTLAAAAKDNILSARAMT